MSATNGSTLLRSRSRIIGVALVAVFALCAMFSSVASAKLTPVKETQLSMGDSLAFGYSLQLFNENIIFGAPATAFENGYANDYLALHKKGKGSQLVNVGCPGETTDSMIGNGPLGSIIDPTGESPCGYHKLGLPLHHEYGGTKSQLESALEMLAIEAGSGTPVTTLTLNIGANDELHAIGKCEAEVKGEFEAEGKSQYGATPAEALEKCIVAHVPSLFTHILTNVGTTLFVLRKGAEFGSVNYGGKIVINGGYDPYGNVLGGGELLANSNALTGALNVEEQKVAAKFGACFANPQPKFNPQNKNEPARLQAYTNMANTTESNGKKNGPDIHPTPVGYEQLAKIMKAACG
jgi:hypothetical protein